jgi:hypothetical protein
MALSRRTRAPRPDLPHDEFARQAALPKPQHREQSADQIDTRELALRKIHPDRDPGYRSFLRTKPCAVKGLTDQRTGQVHVCWSPEQQGRFIPSDAAHTGKSYSGALKRHDSECFPLCRHGHRQQEDNMNDFDKRFGIDRFAIAKTLRAEYLDELERKGQL